MKYLRTSPNVLYELATEDLVWRLNRAVVLVKEDGAKKSNLFDSVARFLNIDSIANIVGMFDKEENDTG